MARWNTCNILHIAPDAKRLWQFDAKGGGFVLGREQRVSHAETLPSKGIAKSWSSLWQPKLNIAWLPVDAVFLRVIELPVSNFEETVAMVELQLEKLSPLPVTQVVWTMHVMGTHQSEAKADGTKESLQTVVVVIAARNAVEEFLGKLEKEGYQADRLEVPLIDQLEAVSSSAAGGPRPGESAADAWLFPISLADQNAALVAWWSGGVLRNLSLVTLPAAGDRAKELQNQLAHIAWSGELEGWLPVPPQWHLVADPVNATEWESALREALNEPVQVVPPVALAEIAGRTAKRAAAAGQSSLLPAEFSTRYRQQFVDRLWLRGLLYVGIAYAVGVAIYFCATQILEHRTRGVEKQVLALGGSYTNSMQLQARYNILKEREQLKYAALDCWQLVAKELPDGMNLQRFSFVDGQTVTLSGQVPVDDISKVIDFSETLRKVKVDGQFVFNQTPDSTRQLTYRTVGNQASWTFGLELLHAEAEPPR
jgi:hypothetical protein